MPRRILIISLLFILAYSNNIKGQAVNANPNFILRSNTLQEKITLITDRTIYSTNENIYFSAKYNIDLYRVSFDWSTVLYVELIKPDGTPIVQGKFSLKSTGASGYIQIPENPLTGRYYLKAYTKWMRNYTPDTYAYTPLTLINAKSADLNAPRVVASEKNDESNKFEIVSDIDINTNKSTFTKREEVVVTINAKNNKLLDYDYCISVVKPELKSLIGLNVPNIIRVPEYDTARFLPEIDGISLSGKVKNRNTGRLEDNATINLTLLNNKSFLSGFRTNSKGEFYFMFPPTKHEYELFIKAEKDDLNLNIEIDDDFCSKHLELPSPELNISELNISLINEMSLNAQISKRYKNTLPIDTNNIKVSFYGTPVRTIYTKKYIDLPYIEEFLFELVPEVYVIHKDKVPSIHTKVKHAFSVFPFLVLVDNIPISDLSDFLKIRTNKIERVEIVDRGYVSGNLKYSGVINAFTIKNDMAGIELPKNSMFFKYKMFSPQNDTAYYSGKEIANERIPDRRNCLYWNPDFKFVLGHKESISFNTSDTKGEYKIILYAISKKTGQILVGEKSFMVE